MGDLRVAAPMGPLRALEVGGAEIPAMIDEVPVLAILAARAEGVTRITGARELRVKESDRLAALAVNLRRIGVEVEELPDGLEIEGTRHRLAGVAECFGDHHIAMCFGVLGATPGCDIRVDDPGVADKSFPGFWRTAGRACGTEARVAAAEGPRAFAAIRHTGMPPAIPKPVAWWSPLTVRLARESRPPRPPSPSGSVIATWTRVRFIGLSPWA